MKNFKAICLSKKVLIHAGIAMLSATVFGYIGWLTGVKAGLFYVMLNVG
jgi:hypothetical protein